ncbi:hypothetical protein PCASD_08629 [Puccinia coronata f. sp. avenae]|uniref:Uncharacterized protein n=1 Tax=Puccinia coronata f. sp. avenae TaxID=200324 RepID=A0A2N5V7D4_9BASI|nr:hypothetical protein PCASD_08629 [Puccinia coronata f. sp. avenae]
MAQQKDTWVARKLLRASPLREGKPGSQKPKIPLGRSNIAPMTAAASSGSSQLESETGLSLVCWGDVALDQGWIKEYWYFTRRDGVVEWGGRIATKQATKAFRASDSAPGGC